MQRNAYHELVNWKNKKERKPLIIRGARQVGKTWLMQHFAREEFPDYAYLNFEGNKRLQDIFSGDFDTTRIARALSIEAGKTISPDTLLVFDEIQEAPAALTALKYFNENLPMQPIITAGSLLGVALHRHTSFPVGKVDFLDLHPLTFEEFLLANGEEQLLQLLQEKDWALVQTFPDRYIELLRQYYYVGGMPEAVRSFAAHKDYHAVRNLQKNILTAYENDFSKYAPPEMVPRIRMLWHSVPAQLAKENRKFIYSHIKEGARAKEYELAMTWLINCGLLHKVSRVTKPALPLKAYEDLSAFKLFLVDVGLLAALTDLPAQALLEGHALFNEYKGALTEQYILQQLLTHPDWNVYYWSAERSQAEIDFLLQITGRLFSLEVKAEENLKSKSLRVVHDTFQPHASVRTSLSNYRKEDWMVNLPLYGIHELAGVG
jgi:predicted AAA+ superfamily ATPase